MGGNHGTLVDNAGYGSGVVGSAFSLDGSSGITLSNNATLQLQDFTIEAWVQRASSSAATLGYDGIGLFFGCGPGGYSFGVDNAGRLIFSQIEINLVTLDVGFTDTQYHHVAVTKSGTNMVFYFDGVGYSVGPYSARFTFSSPSCIGRRGDTTKNGFLGNIDELSIYNRALTPSEINTIHGAYGAGKCAEPLAPVVTGQPDDVVATPGDSALFSVLTTGTAPIRYQWRFRGTDLPGATNYVLNLSKVGATNQGSYQVVVTNAYGAVTSATVALTMASAPMITQHPESVTVSRGEPVVFVVGVSGSPPLSFQWRLNGTTLTGATRYALILTNAQVTDAGSYTVVARNPLGAATSAPAMLLLNCPPILTTQPATQTVPSGANPTFTVSAISPSTLSYQWYHNGAALAGATESLLALNDVGASAAGLYSAVVGNTFGLSTSSEAGLVITQSVRAPALAGLVGWWQGETSTMDATSGRLGMLSGNVGYAPGKVGQAFSLDGAGDGITLSNTPALQLQDFTIEAWVQRGATNRTSSSSGGGLIFSYGHAGYGFGIDNSGHPFLSRIDLDLTNPVCRVVDTNWHHLALTKQETNLVFYLDGVAWPVPGYTGTFSFSSVPAIGFRRENYANSFLGQLDEVAVFNRALSPIEIQSVYFATGQGKCVLPLLWLAQPTNQTVKTRSNVVMGATVSGSLPIRWQWYQNGAPIQGATNSLFAINPVDFFHDGLYTVTASNEAGAITSSNAQLTVVLEPQLAINGSFEFGGASGWILGDIDSPLIPIGVCGAGYDPGFGFFPTAPSQGTNCLVLGFDGDGPGTVRASLDLFLPPSPISLTFSYRAAWDMEFYDGSTQPRTFRVVIRPMGGGSALRTCLLLTALPGTANYDTGEQRATLDLSDFSGSAVQVGFEAFIPEPFTGPGVLQLDDVAFSCSPCPPLRISRSGQNLVLTWPVAFSNFVAIAGSDLRGSAGWAEVGSGLIVRNATNMSLTLPISTNRYHRLKSR